MKLHTLIPHGGMVSFAVQNSFPTLIGTGCRIKKGNTKCVTLIVYYSVAIFYQLSIIGY
jgi:hypothetical protein